MTAVVGFDRKIKLEWLDALADRVAQDHDPRTLRSYLHEVLATEHPGEGARGKTVTVLMRIWARVPEEHEPIRAEAIELLKSISSKDRLWLHWGMCLMAYPIFRDITTSIGRLLKLQDEITWGHVHRRLESSWGERTTVKKAVPRLVRSMVDWQVLDDSEDNKVFTASTPHSSRSKQLQLWMLKAILASQGKDQIEANELLTLPSLFPFNISIGKSDIRSAPGFEVHRQGLDMDMVEMPIGRPKSRAKVIPPTQGILFGDD
jgi:hypothetical protein